MPAITETHSAPTVKGDIQLIGEGEVQFADHTVRSLISHHTAMARKMSPTRVKATRTACTLPVICWP